MAAFSSIAAGIGAAIAAAGTTYSIVESENSKGRAREESEKAIAAQNAAAKKLEDDEAARRKEEELALSAEGDKSAQQAARKRQKALQAGAQGRRDTILTGPLGLPGQAETANKTLLGQ